MCHGYVLLVLGPLGQRSRSQGHHIEKHCPCSKSTMTAPKFTKFHVRVAHVSRMFPIGFGAPGSSLNHHPEDIKLPSSDFKCSINMLIKSKWQTMEIMLYLISNMNLVHQILCEGSPCVKDVPNWFWVKTGSKIEVTGASCGQSLSRQ